MRVPSRRDTELGDPMTPMIDVVFNLLIFFVVTAVGAAPEKLLSADLPSEGVVVTPTATLERESWVTDVLLKLALMEEPSEILQVDMNGTVYQDLDQLKANLRALAEVGPEIPVTLDIAPSVRMEQVVDVWDTCIAAGFATVNFAVDSPGVPTAAEPSIE